MIDRAGLRGWRWQLPLIALLFVALAAAAPGLEQRLVTNPTYEGMGPGTQHWTIVAALLGCLGALFTFWLQRRQRSFESILALSLATVVVTSTLMIAYEPLGRVRAGIDLATAMERRMTPETVLYSVRRLDHTLPFYLQRPMIMVETADELAFGLGIEPQRWLPSLDQFIERWRNGPPAIAVMKPETRDELVQRGIPLTEIAHDARRVAVTNRPD